MVDAPVAPGGAGVSEAGGSSVMGGGMEGTEAGAKGVGPPTAFLSDASSVGLEQPAASTNRIPEARILAARTVLMNVSLYPQSQRDSASSATRRASEAGRARPPATRCRRRR